MAIGELSAVAVLILAMLHEQPMHPYQVHQTLVERGDTRLVRVNAGAVYHGIERLAKEGLVEAAGTERSGNRPERTLYRITDVGRSAFAARLTSFLGDDHRSYPLFPVGLAEAHEIPAETVIDQLTRRRDRQSERLALLRSAWDRVTSLGLPRRYLLDVEHEIATLEADDAWLEQTVDELRADVLGWGRPIPRGYAEARHELTTCQTPPA